MRYAIGCSGFHYAHWKGKFYPEDLPSNKWLLYYTKKFNTVEINNSFYSLPQPETFTRWYNYSPKGFTFSVKGSRFITHVKKLVMDDVLIEATEKFMNSTMLLKEKLQCILWQFPASLRANPKNLNDFCSILSLRHEGNHVFEFRHPSWFNDEIYTILQEHNMSFCIASSPNHHPDFLVTTNQVAYLRFHGTEDWYNHFYTDEELSYYTSLVRHLNASKIFCYFNNDGNAYAVRNALKMNEMLVKSVIKG